MSFPRFVVTPENQSAMIAVQQLAESLCADRRQRAPNPLYIHGPTGTGKSHLISALTDVLFSRLPWLAVNVLRASEIDPQSWIFEMEEDDPIAPPLRSALLVIEDLQHLAKPGRGISQEKFVQFIDCMLSRRRQLVLTANAGPAQLPGLSGRLASRLAGGLVVALEPPGPASRLAILQNKAQRRQLAINLEVLVWLAEHLRGGVRQLEGALLQLEALARQQTKPLAVDSVAAHFRAQVEGSRPTVERIVQRVGSHYRVEPRLMQSHRRHRQILLPRQVSMYLARQLTGLSLGQIGSYFGQRDHSTVLHACRKIERTLPHDAVLSGTVRQLQSALD